MSNLIDRQAAIDMIRLYREDEAVDLDELESSIAMMPSAQPEIVQCRKCKFASGDSRICMKFGHSPIGELDFCAWAERRTDEEANIS